MRLPPPVDSADASVLAASALLRVIVAAALSALLWLGVWWAIGS